MNVWLTTADQANLLTQQANLQFNPDSGTNNYTITLNDTTTYQTMDGFGAAMCDSSGYVMWYDLTAAQRNAAMSDLFDPNNGIGLSLCRLPMGASDMAVSNYSYDDNGGVADPTLVHFSINHDLAYIVPLLKQALSLNPNLKIMGTPWSPPGWMKDSGTMKGGNFLPQYYSAYAQYFVKFIQAYQAQGVPIWAISCQNEPLYNATGYPGMYFPATQELEFIRNYLGPALEVAGLSTKILVYDHNWDQYIYPTTVLTDPVAFFYSEGTAWHWYGGVVSNQQFLQNSFPGKPQWITEAASGNWTGNFGQAIVNDEEQLVIGGTQYWGKGSIKWPFALDTNDGPQNGGCNTCWGLITVNAATQTYSKGVGYYTLGQASKFLQLGAYHVNSNTFGAGNIEDIAFKNPDGSDVVVVLNSNSAAQNFKILWNGQSFTYTLPSSAVATFKWGTSTVVPPPTATPTPQAQTVWRVNAGGPAYNDSLGNAWAADQNSVGGNPATNANPISGTVDPTLYQTERYGPSFLYSFQVSPGKYQVTLKFSENYWTTAGQRVFNVSINGNTVLPNFDIFASAGGANRALDEVFNNIQPDALGRILIQFGPASVDNAKVDAIQILSAQPTPTFTFTATSTPTRTFTPTNTPSWTSTFSATPTTTKTPTSTATSTLSSTSTPSFTPTSTYTPVPPTATPTATLSTSCVCDPDKAFTLNPEWSGPYVQSSQVDVNLGNAPETFVTAAYWQVFGTAPPATVVSAQANNLRTLPYWRRIDVVNTFLTQSGRSIPRVYSEPWASEPAFSTAPCKNVARDVGAVCMFFFSCPGGTNCGMDWANTHVEGMNGPSTLLGFGSNPSGVYTSASNPGFWYRELMDARYAGLSYLLPNVYGPDLSDGSIANLVSALNTINGTGITSQVKIGMFDDTWGWTHFSFAPWNNPPWTTPPENLSAAGVTAAASTIYQNKWKPFFNQIPSQYWYEVNGHPLIYLYNAGTLPVDGSSQPTLATIIQLLKNDFQADFGVTPYVVIDIGFSYGNATVADNQFVWNTLQSPYVVNHLSVYTNNGITAALAMVKWDPKGRDDGGSNAVATSTDGIIKDGSYLQAALNNTLSANFLTLATWNDLGEGTGINRNYDYYFNGTWQEPDFFMNLIRHSQQGSSCPSPTPTASATPVQSPTPTSSATQTRTPSSSPTGTSTTTSTSSPSPTQTPMVTATSTSTATGTASATSTLTATSSATSSLTTTFTTTSTSSSSFTNTSTVSLTPTATASTTPSTTPTRTASPTPTKTSSPIFTPTSALTPSSTNTSTPSGTPTATVTLTFTLSNTFTNTLTPTYTPTTSTTATPSATASQTPTASPTSTGTSSPTLTTSPSATPTATFIVTRTPTTTPSAQSTAVVYPNPWDGDGGKPLKLHVNLSSAGEVKVKLFTTAFRKVWQEDFQNQPAGEDRLVLGISNLANGIYYLVLEAPGKRWTIKLLVLG